MESLLYKSNYTYFKFKMKVLGRQLELDASKWTAYSNITMECYTLGQVHTPDYMTPRLY